MPDDPEQPRLAPLAPKQWPPTMRDALAALRPENPRHPFPPRDESRPKGLNILGTLAWHPELTTAYHTLTGHILFGTTLSLRQRELLVLRVATVRDATYEWLQHVVLAGDAGISPDEIDRVVDGPGAPGWSPFEVALLSAVDELLTEARIGPDTWQTLAAELDEQQLLDLIVTVGTYDTLAMVMRSCGTPVDDDLRGWKRPSH